MKFYSTRNKSHKTSLRNAVLDGLAPDGGLYLPESIPLLDDKFLSHTSQLSLIEIGQKIANLFLGNDIAPEKLSTIVSETLNFPIPLVNIQDDIDILEISHGPTLAFKDVAARFMSRLMALLNETESSPLTILAATSGDTGSAVADGFYNVPGINVVLLYPEGKVSALQERQFTTLGGNITALKISGTFDDCQSLVKQAFNDATLRNSMRISSANSINIARLIPQSFYHTWAWSRVSSKKPLVVSVPSGNYGNLCAGLIAKKMGVPIAHFVASSNANSVVPEYLAGQTFAPRPSVSTISNAMDVGNPSNFERILSLYDNQRDALQKDVSGYHFNDEQTRDAMLELYKNSSYVACPHSAVGYLGLKKFLSANSDYHGIFLGTAHPAKFQDIVEATIKSQIALPIALQDAMQRKSKSIAMSASYPQLKEFLLSQ